MYFQRLSKTVGSSARHTRDTRTTVTAKFCCDVILWTTTKFFLLTLPVIFSGPSVVGVRSAFSGPWRGAFPRQ